MATSSTPKATRSTAGAFGIDSSKLKPKDLPVNLAPSALLAVQRKNPPVAVAALFPVAAESTLVAPIASPSAPPPSQKPLGQPLSFVSYQIRPRVVQTKTNT